MAKLPVFRISLTNATLLAGVYLLAGVTVELVRRVFNPRWADSLSKAFESFPARMLELVGLFAPLRHAWMEGHLADVQVRLLYGLTTVALIYALGLGVGGAMWVVMRLGRGGDDPESHTP